MQARAEARYIRSSPQKARLVVDLIRGRSANEARIILRQTNKRMAPTVLKVLDSAIANAENRNNDVDVDELVVSEAYVNEGPRQKRIRPAPMGRAYRYRGGRRTSPQRLAHVLLDQQHGQPGGQDLRQHAVDPLHNHRRQAQGEP